MDHNQRLLSNYSENVIVLCRHLSRQDGFRSVIYIFIYACIDRPIPVAASSKTWVCGRLFVGIVGSNPPRSVDVCFLCMLKAVK